MNSVTSDRKRYNVFTIDKVKSMGCRVKDLDLGNGKKSFDREASSARVLNSTIADAKDFPVTSDVEAKLLKHGTQVTQDCSWAARPYIYRFTDGYVYLPSSRSVARIYPNSKVPSNCRNTDDTQIAQ